MATPKKSKQSSSLVFFLIVFTLLLDRFTKNWASSWLVENGPVHLFGPFALQYATNTGAAFSLLQEHPQVLLFLSLVLVGVLFYVTWSTPATHRLLPWGFGLMLGGALGNIIDRILQGYVIDFLASTFWPTFNVADSALTVGVVLIAYVMLTQKDDGAENTEKNNNNRGTRGFKKKPTTAKKVKRQKKN